jgi:hypothetical protein
MRKLSFLLWVRNAAAVFSGVRGEVSTQARRAGCSRQTVYENARKLQARERQRDELRARLAERGAELRDLRRELDQRNRRGEYSLVDRPELLRRVVTTLFVLGLSIRSIAAILILLLPKAERPSRARVGRWIKQAGTRARRALKALDDACDPRVRRLAVDELFFGGGRS